MADASTINRPLTRAQVVRAHELIKPFIHLTPVQQCSTISTFASTPQDASALVGTRFEGQTPANPKIRIFFKCENQQKVGAFKARGAFHALSRLTQGELENGVITHSSGNHAQALAFAARTRKVPAYIIMPKISTPSKIAGTASYGAEITFSGSTEEERLAVVNDVQARTGGVLVPPYDHPDIILGQGTMAIEFEEQVKSLYAQERHDEREREGWGWRSRVEERHRLRQQPSGSVAIPDGEAALSEGLDAVITPCGGGGMLSGVATALAGTGISVFGAEPSFQGADDACRGLAMDPPTRVDRVKTLTIADGLRTPVGKLPWTIISDRSKVRGMYSVTEEQIKAALRLLMERAKLFVEPSAAVPLAVVLFDEDFRHLVEREAGRDGWNIGVVLSGGNTTMESLAKLYNPSDNHQATAAAVANGEREAGQVDMDGGKIVENIPG